MNVQTLSRRAETGLGQPLGAGPGEDLNGHRKGVYRQFNMKRKTMENVDLLLKWCRRPADKPDGR